MLVMTSIYCQSNCDDTGHLFSFLIFKNISSVKYIISEMEGHQIAGSLSSISFTRLQALQRQVLFLCVPISILHSMVVVLGSLQSQA